MANSIDHRRFWALLSTRFPEVVASVDKCSQGLIHLEVATLARATQMAIVNQENATVLQHFKFIDEVLREAAPDLKNAIIVSYLENLQFNGRKASPTQAHVLLTPRLQQEFAELEEYLAALFRR